MASPRRGGLGRRGPVRTPRELAAYRAAVTCREKAAVQATFRTLETLRRLPPPDQAPPAPPGPPPPIGHWEIPRQNQELWRWLVAQGSRPVIATATCDGSGPRGVVHHTHLWDKGGWRADGVLRRATLSNGGDLQEFFGDQAREQQISPCYDPIIAVSVHLARVRAA
jgi:hypothetical protein